MHSVDVQPRSLVGSERLSIVIGQTVVTSGPTVVTSGPTVVTSGQTVVTSGQTVVTTGPKLPFLSYLSAFLWRSPFPLQVKTNLSQDSSSPVVVQQFSSRSASGFLENLKICLLDTTSLVMSVTDSRTILLCLRWQATLEHCTDIQYSCTHASTDIQYSCTHASTDIQYACTQYACFFILLMVSGQLD